MPFASTCDEYLNSYISKAPDTTDNVMNKPTLNTVFSPLRKSLNHYLGDSTGIFSLDLYKVTINDGFIEKIFFKNIEICDYLNEVYKQTKITLTLVNCLGVEYKAICHNNNEPKSPDTKEINLQNKNIQIKIYNLFYKNNVPFNYKNTSNNGWLEMFIDDKYNFEQTDKFCIFKNFLQLNKETKYYDEFNIPQTELESRFQNYKVKSLLIESNSPKMKIKYDDDYEINLENKIDFGNLKKNATDLKLKIKIEPYEINDERYSIPIATFVTI